MTNTNANIPKGTLWAIVVTWISYGFFAFQVFQILVGVNIDIGVNIFWLVWILILVNIEIGVNIGWCEHWSIF